MSAPLPVAGGRRRLAVPTSRLGWSEGDVWTVAIGLALALALAVSTIPAVLDARGTSQRAAAPSAVAPAAPADPGAVAPVVADDARPVAPAPPVAQPLLGPLAPLAPVPEFEQAVPPAGPAPGSSPGPARAARLAPGAVRQFAALPGDSTAGAVAAGPDGSVLAGTDAPPNHGGAAQLLSWDADGVLIRSADVPGQPAARTRGLTGVAQLTGGSLAAVDAATSRLLRYDASDGSWSALAVVPDVAPCLVLRPSPCQPGPLDTAPLLRGVTVDSAGSIYVADAGQGTIWRLQPGRPIEPWYSSADVEGADGVAGLAVDAEGHLLATITRLAGLPGSASGALLRIDRAKNGRAGARSLVAAFSAGEDPVDVALGASGRAYVALRGADAVVTLDDTGFEQLRIVDDALQDPSSLDLGAGRLLVSAGGPSSAVLEVGADDAPLAPGPSPSTAGGTSRG